MSTEFPLLKSTDEEVTLIESSCQFSICLLKGSVGEQEAFDSGSYTPEQIASAAMQMLQATLYNVDDPASFFRDHILQPVNKLFI